MTPTEVLDIGRDAIWTLLQVSSPVMIIALVVGLLIALLQALTQIQEATIVFVPKIIAIFVSLLIFMPSMGIGLGDFMSRISDHIAGL